jgi:hypothetical protein
MEMAHDDSDAHHDNDPAVKGDASSATTVCVCVFVESESVPLVS